LQAKKRRGKKGNPALLPGEGEGEESTGGKEKLEMPAKKKKKGSKSAADFSNP